MTISTRPYLMPVEYLAFERAAEYKNEYFNGEVFSMSGVSRQHDRITDDFMAEVHPQPGDGPCETYTSRMRVKVSPTGLYTYPDGTVVCGEAEFDDEHVDTLLNPTMILEMLSPSTEAYHRGVKFEHYKNIPTLTYSIPAAQTKARVEVYTRQEGETWLYKDVTDLGLSVQLPAIGCALAMCRIYRRVTFPPVESLHPSPP